MADWGMSGGGGGGPDRTRAEEGLRRGGVGSTKKVAWGLLEGTNPDPPWGFRSEE